LQISDFGFRIADFGFQRSRHGSGRDEEADESLYWLEIFSESSIVKRELVINLMKEADELISIFVATLKTAKGR
jgi:hypothetical protein